MFFSRQRSEKKHKITWPQLNRTVEVGDGQTVLDAAIENDLPLEHACGGFCACTTCHIIVKDGLDRISKMEEDEMDRLENKDGLTPASRLACQSKVHGDITVEIPGYTG